MKLADMQAAALDILKRTGSVHGDAREVLIDMYIDRQSNKAAG